MTIDPRATIIDMTPDGSFTPQRQPRLFQPTGLTLVAIVAGTVLIGAGLVFWLAITLLPFLLAVILAGFAYTKLRSWQRRFGHQRGRVVPR